MGNVQVGMFNDTLVKEEVVSTYITEVREKVLKYGADSLSNSEILTFLFKGASRKKDPMTLSAEILNCEDGIRHIATASIQELINQIGEAKAFQMRLTLELAKRISRYKPMTNKIGSPEDVANLVMEDMRYLKKEVLKVLFLNTKNHVMSINDLSIGSLNASVVHPREIFSEAIRRSAAAIIICHNHPSGDPTQSQEDINITKRLYEVGKLIGIDLLDHVIIGDGCYISLKEKGIL